MTMTSPSARRAGFSLAVARDLFVHHFGSRTFVGNGVDAEKLLDENAQRFADKWGQAAPEGRRIALRPWSSWPEFLADSQKEFARQVDEGRIAEKFVPRINADQRGFDNTTATTNGAIQVSVHGAI